MFSVICERCSNETAEITMKPREISKETLYLISVEVAVPVREYMLTSLRSVVTEIDENTIAEFDTRKVERYPVYVERNELQAQPTSEIVRQLSDAAYTCDLATLINVFIMHFDLLQEINVADRLLFSAFHALKTVRNLYSHPPQPEQQAVFSATEQIRHCKVCIDVLEQIAPTSTTKSRIQEHILKLEGTTRAPRQTRGAFRYVLLIVVFVAANVFLLLQPMSPGYHTMQELRYSTDSSVLFLFDVGDSDMPFTQLKASELRDLSTNTNQYHLLVGRTFGHGWHAVPHSIANDSGRVAALTQAIEMAANRRQYPDWSFAEYKQDILADVQHARLQYPISSVIVFSGNTTTQLLPHQIGTYTQ